MYIAILNYNNWRDTVECLESILLLKSVDFKVIIVDNNSDDHSLENIELWLNNNLNLAFKFKVPGTPVCYPERPVKYSRFHYIDPEFKSIRLIQDSKITLIEAQENSGYAGGNNLAIKYALKEDDFDYIWILNNDTVVHPDSLRHLQDKAREYHDKNKKIGIIGSKIYHYYNPKKIQYAGGSKYYKYGAYSRALGKDEYDHGQWNNEDIKMDLIAGSSMFVSKKFIKEVGLLGEQYFLYFEELDWNLRGIKSGWNLGYCPESVIYHKEGSATGTNNINSTLSELSFFYSVRNKILFTKTYFPYCIIWVYMGLIWIIIQRIIDGRIGLIPMIFKIFFNQKRYLKSKWIAT